MSLVLFQNLLIDLVVLPVLETLGSDLERPARMGNPVLGRFMVCLYSLATNTPFVYTRTLSRPLGTKNAPVPTSWDEALSCGIAAHALRLTTQLRCTGNHVCLASDTRLAYIGDHPGDAY